jgi:hypothetical protein
LGELLASIAFQSAIIEWRGPAPFLFVPIPEEHFGEIRWAAREVSYGWGVVPVEALIDGIAFKTSLFPRDGSYLLPVKIAVQRAANLVLGDEVRVQLQIHSSPSRLSR